MCTYLPNDFINHIDFSHFEAFVGRRRFAATLVEQMLLSSSNSEETIDITKEKLLLQLEKCWRDIPSRSNMSSETINQFFHLSRNLISAFLISGCPILLQNTKDSEMMLVKLFETGIGILEKFNKYVSSRLIQVSLKEPLVMISGDKVFNVSDHLIQCTPSTPLSSLGFMWETCVSKTLHSRAAPNGLVDIASVFGIDQGVLNGTPLESPLLLKNFSNSTILAKLSIEDFLLGNTNVPIVSPDSFAGPDAMFRLGEYPVFCQMKFRQGCSLGKSFMTLTPRSFYKDINGDVPARFKPKVEKILGAFTGNVVIRILFCYPHVVTSDMWKNHFRMVNPRRSSRNVKHSDSLLFCDILVDGRNANSFFGQAQVDMFDQVREQARIYEIPEETLDDTDIQDHVIDAD